MRLNPSRSSNKILVHDQNVNSGMRRIERESSILSVSPSLGHVPLCSMVQWNFKFQQQDFLRAIHVN